MTASRKLNAGDVRLAEFSERSWRKGAYEREKIDQLLELIAERLDTGASPVDLVRHRKREKLRRGRGYDAAEVDLLLNKIAREFADKPGTDPMASQSISETSDDPWRAGSAPPTEPDDLPGTRLTFRSRGRERLLLSSDGEVLVKIRSPRASYWFNSPFFESRRTLSVVARGKRYTLRFAYPGLGGYRMVRNPKHVPNPDISAVAALIRPLMAENSKVYGQVLRSIQQLTDDSSGVPTLWMSAGTSWYHRLDTELIVLSNQRAFHVSVFRTDTPVLVAATDDSGGRHVFYKWPLGRGETSVVVKPSDELSEGFLLAVALAASKARLARRGR